MCISNVLLFSAKAYELLNVPYTVSINQVYIMKCQRVTIFIEYNRIFRPTYRWFVVYIWFNSSWNLCTVIEKNSGSALVVVQVKVFLCGSYEYCCYLGGDGLDLLRVWVTNLWTVALGSRACTVSCIWGFMLSCSQIFISNTVCI